MAVKRETRTRMALVLGWLCLAPAVLLAQSYAFKVFYRESGLTDLDIHCIVQDRTGFLWVGTQFGLFRYDGAEFQRYIQSSGLPDAAISSLHEDRDGTLWVGTPHGLARRVETRFEPLLESAAWEVWDNSAIDSTPAGDLYVAAANGLWLRRHGEERFEKLPWPDGLPTGEGHSVRITHDGGVWFGCADRLCLLQNGRPKAYGPAQGVPPGRWSSLRSDKDGTLWARSSSALIAIARGASAFTARDRGLEPGSDIHDMYIDRAGRLLVSTRAGLARSTGEGWEYPARKPGLPSDLVSSVYQDREGSVWIGTRGGGLSRWLGYGDWQSWTENDGLPNQMVWSITGDGAGGVWVGNDRQLARVHRDGHVSRMGPNGGRVFAYEVDGRGRVWTGGPEGVGVYDPRDGSWREYGAASGLPKTLVRGLAQDDSGDIWVSTNEGLFRGTPHRGGIRFEQQTPLAGERDKRFYRLVRDGSGNLWAGSRRGLWRYQAGVWTVLMKRDGLLDDMVNHIAAAPDGSLLLAYARGLGVTRIDWRGQKLSLTHYTTASGLKSDLVYSLGADRTGDIWVGTDAGVDVLDKGIWRHLDQRDGLVWDDLNSDAFYAAPDGYVWMGTARGLSRYGPAHEWTDALPAPAVITAVMAGKEIVAPSSHPSVPYSDRSVLVKFAAPTFVKPDDVRFRYRLSGLEDRWVESRRREQLFQALPPGEYTFEVIAANAAGVWSARPAQFTFLIQAPWWRTTWFALLCLAAGGMIAWQLWRWRVHIYLRRQKQLEQLVTQRTQLVERQKQSIEELLRKAEQASKAKSEFLANVSHEIRTPMTGVLGMADMLLETRLDARQQEYLGMLRSSADALLLLLNDVLDLSKIEAGKLELDPIGFSLRPVVTNAVGVLQSKARRKGLDLVVAVRDDVPQHVRGDPRRLRQVIVNLVSNAVKFTEEGTVTVTVEQESSAAGPDLLRFSVADTGIGIRADKQQLIFEPFGQADNSTTRRYGGTGLGLTICLQLVTLMEGRIWVESEPGKGSAFRFVIPLPAIASAPETPEPVAPEAPTKSRLRILLAEDQPVNQKIAVALLEKMGHQVKVANHGLEALHWLETETFDVVLMDVYMPELDGFETTRVIRERESGTGRRTPIVAVTALAMQSDRERCLQAGMDAYVTKPFQPAKMIAAIREALAVSDAGSA